MKRYLMKATVILLFIVMLILPGEVFEGACSGLLLWFNSVLPTLLPFIIVSGLLIKTRAVDWIVRITGPVLCPVFGVTHYGSFAVITGFLCGYPMGSKVTCDLLKEGHISQGEARYLLSFCNNASPVFIISYLVLQNLSEEKLVYPALLILMGSPVLASFLFRRLWKTKGSTGDKVSHFVDKSAISVDNPARHAENFSIPHGVENIVDTCIMNGFEMITKVGGYIMLFSILMSLAERSGIKHFLFRFLLLPSLEITSGISLLCEGALSKQAAFFLCMTCTSFGGFCAAAQTSCMISGTGLSIKTYTIEKLITAMVTSLLCCLYLYFIY